MGLIKFLLGLALYVIVVVILLMYVPDISVAARVSMTWKLWLCVAGGFFWGAYIGSCFVFMFLGARPLAYGRWDFSREREVKTLFGQLIIIFIMTAVGIFFANLALDWGLHNI